MLVVNKGWGVVFVFGLTGLNFFFFFFFFCENSQRKRPMRFKGTMVNDRPNMFVRGLGALLPVGKDGVVHPTPEKGARSEEHTSEPQSH